MKNNISGHNPESTHYEDLASASKYLTYYTILKEDKTKRRLSYDAKKILSLRINPSGTELNIQSQRLFNHLQYLQILYS